MYTYTGIAIHENPKQIVKTEYVKSYNSYFIAFVSLQNNDTTIIPTKTATLTMYISFIYLRLSFSVALQMVPSYISLFNV